MEDIRRQHTNSPNSNRDGLSFFKSIFFNNSGSSNGADADSVEAFTAAASPNEAIPSLSPLANSVISRCSKILRVSMEELQCHFETELPESVKQPPNYARNLLEFCSYRALHLLTDRPNYLKDKEFSRLTYDMMLAWEAPDLNSEPLENAQGTASSSNQEAEDEDGWSLFYSSSTNLAAQVDGKKTVGMEAFSRIAPACAIVADIITMDNLFDALTSSSSHRLHFLIYDKYLRSLEKVIKSVNSAFGPQLISKLQLAEGEIILDIDGTIPTQPVLQRIGLSSWPGRLTLTNYALYFESLGVGLYEKAVRYDLATDMKQVIKPELTGPLGARLFDKAVMYKATSMAEPIYLDFPEFKGSSRRDYWLDICLEIMRAHKFIRRYNLKEIQQTEVLARAVLGIFRCRAVKEAFQIFSSHYKTLLCFNLAESLPGGDRIFETLSSRLALLNASGSQRDSLGSPNRKMQLTLPFSVLTLSRLKIMTGKEALVDGEEETVDPVGDVCVGETNPLEIAVKQSKQGIGRAEAAQATVDQVKVEGIDTNIAVMKELLFPLIETFKRIQLLASWEDPTKSTMFLLLVSYTILRHFGIGSFFLFFQACLSFVVANGMQQQFYLWEIEETLLGWIKYAVSSIIGSIAMLMLWRRHTNKGRPLDAFNITAPPTRNAVEQLLTLQEAISQVEALIQSGNIILLKVRALLFAALPQATDFIALLLVFMAVIFALVPLNYITLLLFLEAFTREMPLRKATSDRWLRRVREWWFRIPAAPVQLIKPDDKKRN
ncbi:hypothetical protein RJ640_013507 [Escallonia rubra]|uniref:Uncharacterized protein n=1 Tax=Escallonia rubra TaxID=112253 RepID=A0AA88S499_9ASTE|nr:hypothetical protein RJ640_013507 [Escallonia rubra]